MSGAVFLCHASISQKQKKIKMGNRYKIPNLRREQSRLIFLQIYFEIMVSHD